MSHHGVVPLRLTSCRMSRTDWKQKRKKPVDDRQMYMIYSTTYFIYVQHLSTIYLRYDLISTNIHNFIPGEQQNRRRERPMIWKRPASGSERSRALSSPTPRWGVNTPGVRSCRERGCKGHVFCNSGIPLQLSNSGPHRQPDPKDNR